MKKIVLLLMLLTLGCMNTKMFAQYYNDVYMRTNTEMPDYGTLIKRSCQLQYAALGSAVVSVASFVAFSSLDSKYNYTYDKKGNQTDKKMRSPAKNYLIAGAGFAAVAIACEIAAIDFKMQAGKMLSLQMSETGPSLSFKF